MIKLEKTKTGKRIVGEIVPYRLSLLSGLSGGTTFFRFTAAPWGVKRKGLFPGSERCGTKEACVLLLAKHLPPHLGQQKEKQRTLHGN